MRLTSVLFCLFCLAFVGLAQEKENYSAMILSLDGEGVLIRDSKETKLKIPQRFLSSDKLSVKKGNATIMLFSGEEVNMSAVSNYTIPTEKQNVDSEFSNMANGNKSGKSLLSQSGAAYQLRGESRVFPTSSKVLNQDNTVLKLGYDAVEELNLTLKVVDAQTQKTIYQTETISDNTISLAKVPFKTNKSYYWVLGNTPNGKPEMGTIVMATNGDTKRLATIANPQTHYEYMQAISSYYNGNYYFETLHTLNQAIEKYPDHNIYQVLLNNLLSE